MPTVSCHYLLFRSEGKLQAWQNHHPPIHGHWGTKKHNSSKLSVKFRQSVSSTLTCGALPSTTSSLLPVFLLGEGEATIVDRGLANCEAVDDIAGDLLELASRRRDNGTEFAVCRLTGQRKTRRHTAKHKPFICFYGMNEFSPNAEDNFSIWTGSGYSPL